MPLEESKEAAESLAVKVQGITKTTGKQEKLNATALNALVSYALLQTSWKKTDYNYSGQAKKSLSIAGDGFYVVVHSMLDLSAKGMEENFIAEVLTALETLKLSKSPSTSEAGAAPSADSASLLKLEGDASAAEEPSAGVLPKKRSETAGSADIASDNTASSGTLVSAQTLTASPQEIHEKKCLTDIIHVIPIISKGTRSNHAQLMIVTQPADETFSNCFNDKKYKKIFDPRDLGLGAQGASDNTNCGRYVIAMTIQAAGLARDDLPITKENLKVNPAVRRALHFNFTPGNSEKDKIAQTIMTTYVKPLSKNPTSQEIISHNLAKIKCLKMEYEYRAKIADRAYHGTAIFGGYRSAGIFAKTFGFNAEQKLAAVNAIEKAFGNVKNRENVVFNLPRFGKAAAQGELGACFQAIIKAQKKIAAESVMKADKSNRLR